MIGRQLDSIFDQVSSTLTMSSNTAAQQVAATTMDCKDYDTNDGMLFSSSSFPVDELLSSPILCVSHHDFEHGGENKVETMHSCSSSSSSSKGNGGFLDSTFVPGRWDVVSL